MPAPSPRRSQLFTWASKSSAYVIGVLFASHSATADGLPSLLMMPIREPRRNGLLAADEYEPLDSSHSRRDCFDSTLPIAAVERCASRDQPSDLSNSGHVRLIAGAKSWQGNVTQLCAVVQGVWRQGKLLYTIASLALTPSSPRLCPNWSTSTVFPQTVHFTLHPCCTSWASPSPCRRRAFTPLALYDRQRRRLICERGPLSPVARAVEGYQKRPICHLFDRLRKALVRPQPRTLSSPGLCASVTRFYHYTNTLSLVYHQTNTLINTLIHNEGWNRCCFGGPRHRRRRGRSPGSCWLPPPPWSVRGAILRGPHDDGLRDGQS